MSVEMVSRAHVAALVHWWVSTNQGESDFDGGAQIADMLYQANARAVCEHGYRIRVALGTLIPFTAHEIERPQYILTNIEAYKAARSLNYQCCELDDWDRSPAGVMVANMRKESAERFAISTDEYDDAAWLYVGTKSGGPRPVRFEEYDENGNTRGDNA